jgi:hypothetical protein
MLKHNITEIHCNETYSEVRTHKHLSHEVAIQNGLKQRDAYRDEEVNPEGNIPLVKLRRRK